MACLGATGCDEAVRSPAPTEELPWQDRSLTVEDYIRRGVPAPDRPWLAEEMTRAATALEAIAKEDGSRLPRHESAKSGPIFARIVSVENHDILVHPSLPMELRVKQANAFLVGFNAIYSTYLRAFSSGTVGDSDFLELLGAQLHTQVILVKQAEEFARTLDPKDPTYGVRMEGLVRVSRSVAGLISLSISVLAETNLYRESALTSFLVHVKRAIPALVSATSSAARLETLTRLEKLARHPPVPSWAGDLNQLLTEVRLSAEASGHGVWTQGK